MIWHFSLAELIRTVVYRKINNGNLLSHTWDVARFLSDVIIRTDVWKGYGQHLRV